MKVHVLASKSNNRMSHIIADKLKNEREHEFVYVDDPEALTYEKSLTIMGTVRGLENVRIYADFRNLGTHKLSSLATRTLLEFAKDTQKRVKIIGLPPKGNIDDISREVSDSLQELQESSFQRLDRL